VTDEKDKKRRNFGLAAQLAQPRPIPVPQAVEPEPPTLDELSDGPAIMPAEKDRDEAEAANEERLERSEHTERSKSSGRKKKPGHPPRQGGYVRRTITLGPSVSTYVDRAWRTYQTTEGKYVKGVSGFIEALIDEHRRKRH
jgi:hypothetical protein